VAAAASESLADTAWYDVWPLAEAGSVRLWFLTVGNGLAMTVVSGPGCLPWRTGLLLPGQAAGPGPDPVRPGSPASS